MAEAMQFGATDPVPVEPGPTQPSQIAPSLHERTTAMLAHLLQIVAFWAAPLIIFVVKRESKFVAFHALQALLLQVLYLFLLGLTLFFCFAAVVLAMISAHSAGSESSSPAFFIFVPMLWLAWMSTWAGMVVIAAVYGVKAGRGEWVEYPFVGRLARKMLKLGPGSV